MSEVKDIILLDQKGDHYFVEFILKTNKNEEFKFGTSIKENGKIERPLPIGNDHNLELSERLNIEMKLKEYIKEIEQ